MESPSKIIESLNFNFSKSETMGWLLIKKNTCPLFRTRQVNQLRSSETHLVLKKDTSFSWSVTDPLIYVKVYWRKYKFQQFYFGWKKVQFYNLFKILQLDEFFCGLFADESFIQNQKIRIFWKRENLLVLELPTLFRLKNAPKSLIIIPLE